MSNTERKVAIIGAGLAGTAAGLGLVNAGFDVTIYSDRDHVVAQVKAPQYTFCKQSTMPQANSALRRAPGGMMWRGKHANKIKYAIHVQRARCRTSQRSLKRRFAAQLRSQLSATTLGKAGHTIRGVARVGAAEGIGNYFLSRTLGTFALAHPNLVVQLVALPRIFSLSRRQADIVVTLDRPKHMRLFVRKLTEYSFGIYDLS